MLMRDIIEFHEKFDLLYGGPPRKLPAALEDFRIRFMQEELDEYKKATKLEDKLDALVDLCYVALGTAQFHGFDFMEAWSRVHAANMKKIRSASARSVFDIVKPEGWVPPDHSDLV